MLAILCPIYKIGIVKVALLSSCSTLIMANFNIKIW